MAKDKKFKIKKGFTIKKEESKFTISKEGNKTSSGRKNADEEMKKQEDNNFVDFVIPAEEPSTFYRSGSVNLDHIIKSVSKIDKSDIVNGKVQKHVKLNSKTGKIVKRGFSLYNKADRFFIINTSKNTKSPELAYKINIPPIGAVTLHGAYEVSVGEDYNQFVESLATSNNPATALNDLIIKWIEEVFSSGGEEFLFDFHTYKDRIQRQIKGRADNYGIDFKINLRLKNEKIVERNFQFSNSNYFPVQLKGDVNRANINYEAHISCYTPHKIQAIVKYNNFREFPAFVTKCMQQLLKDYNYGEIYQGFSNEQILEIKDKLNRKLQVAEKGWKVDSLYLSLKNDFKPAKHLKIEKLPIELPLRTANNKAVELKVFNTLVLNLKDPEKAKANWNNVSKLYKWAEDTLQTITYNTLMNIEYSQLLINREEFEEKIKNSISELAEEIGYSINNFITIPDVESVKLGDRFDFSTGANKEYSTKIGDKVKLEIIVQYAQIRDFKKIKDYLTPDTDIIDEMKKVIDRTVTHFLHKIDPDDYYTNFEAKLQNQLSTLIKDALRKEFHVSNKIEILAKRAKTKLIDRFEKLRQGFHSFQFENFGELKYNCRYSVNAIDPDAWSTFNNNNFETKEEELESINEHLKDFLETHLNDTLSIEFKNVKDPRFSKGLKKVINAAQSHIQDTFGLMIKVTSLKRHKTLIEKRYGKKQELEHEGKMTEIEGKRKLIGKISADKVKEYDNLKALLKSAEEEEDHERAHTFRQQLGEIEADAYGHSTDEDDLRSLEGGLHGGSDQSLNNFLPEGDSEYDDEF